MLKNCQNCKFHQAHYDVHGFDGCTCSRCTTTEEDILYGPVVHKYCNNKMTWLDNDVLFDVHIHNGNCTYWRPKDELRSNNKEIRST